MRRLEELNAAAIEHITNNSDLKGITRGSRIMTLIEAINRSLVGIQSSLDFHSDMLFLDRASGVFLDRIGEMFNVERRKNIYAMDNTLRNVKFYFVDAKTLADLQPSLDQYVIPSGTTLMTSTSPPAVSVTTSDAVFLPASTHAYVNVIASVPGEEGNVGKGQLNRYEMEDTTFDTGELLITNEHAIESGEMNETDDNYRARIKASRMTQATGNQSAIVSAALDVPGVRNVLLRNNKPYLGAITVYVESQTPRSNAVLINAVQTAVQQVAAAGTSVYVKSPEYIDLQMTIPLVTEHALPAAEKNDVVSSTKYSIAQYINDLGMLGEVVPDAIQRLILGEERIKYIGRYAIRTRYKSGWVDRSSNEIIKEQIDKVWEYVCQMKDVHVTVSP